MGPRSQPASMPTESNLDQTTHLISPARSELSEIDPSWEIRALADADGSISIGTSSAHGGATLCASPHTPVCAPPPDLSPDPAANTLSDAATVRRLESERARKKKARAKKAEARRLVAIAAAAGDAGREMREAHAERDALRGALAAIRDALAVAQLRHGVSPPLSLPLSLSPSLSLSLPCLRLCSPLTHTHSCPCSFPGQQWCSTGGGDGGGCCCCGGGGDDGDSGGGGGGGDGDRFHTPPHTTQRTG